MRVTVEEGSSLTRIAPTSGDTSSLKSRWKLHENQNQVEENTLVFIGGEFGVPVAASFSTIAARKLGAELLSR